MRIKKGFVLHPALGYTVVIATGELASQFSSMIKLNETSADVWRWVDEGLEHDEIIERFTSTYKVGRDTAERDVDAVIAKMKSAGVFED